MGELRKEGALHMSNEVVQVASLLAAFISLNAVWSWLYRDMRLILEKSFALMSRTEPLTPRMLYDGFIALLVILGPELLIIGAAVAIVAALSVLLQTNFNVKEKKIQFKGDFLNPIKGIGKIFSPQGAVRTLQALLKLCLILPVAYYALKRFAPEMVMLIHLSIEEVFHFTGMAMMWLFWKILYILIAFAIFDFFWTKHQWLKQNRMTKDEVKDERKSIEGDEETRRKIQAKGLQRIMQRIQQSVPQADVVVTNPTHFAVALKYNRASMTAPTVVAKGKGFLAQRIKEIARESGVPVLERKVLARALYHSVEVGTEIPFELFKAVAEVLAYVYRLKNPYGAMNAST
jgi:flagellar biosynthetic protein FlhB